MCDVDLSPVTEIWYETAEIWAPNFKTTHTCRNFSQILDWALERHPSVRAKQPPGMEKAKDKTLDMSGERLRLHLEHTKETSHHH